MAGMWELPTRELDRGRGLALWPGSFPAGLRFERAGEAARLRHAITQHRVRAAVLHARVRAVVAPALPVLWADAHALAELPLTGLTRKALSAASGGATGA
jgi:hypothetical protein